MNEYSESLLLGDESDLSNLNFFGLTICPMRQIFKDSMEDMLQKNKEEKDLNLRCYIPSGCGCTADVEPLVYTEEINEFPDVFASIGFREMFKNSIVDKFINKNVFKSAQNKDIHEEFLDARFIDPKGIYTMYAVSPIVILIDKKKLGDLPVPKVWADLLNPIYKDNIILEGSENEIYEHILLYFYKEFGYENLKTIAHNIKDACHSVEMVKRAGTAQSTGAAIYALPWFFAKSCPRRDETFIVWPEDGAILNPLCLLAKESNLEKTSLVVDFLLGTEYGTRSANNYFPSINSNVNNKLPLDAKFKWLGWDFIRNNNIEELIISTNEMFTKERWNL